jgi:hypothetical protein
MDRPKIDSFLSTLMDSSLYLRMPLHERMSLLLTLLESYPSLLASEVDGGDEETEIGYESSWSGIFPTCEQGD